MLSAAVVIGALRVKCFTVVYRTIPGIIGMTLPENHTVKAASLFMVCFFTHIIKHFFFFINLFEILFVKPKYFFVLKQSKIFL